MIGIFLSVITGSMAVSFNVNDKTSIAAAQKGIAAKLMSYYSPSPLGTIPEKASEGPDGFQWYDMGIYWGAMMEYSLLTSDSTYFKTIGGALANASFGPTASFLGDAALQQFSATTGKWNDDILWWGLAGNPCF